MTSLMASAPSVICSELRIGGTCHVHYYLWNDNFEFWNHQVSLALPIERLEPGTFRYIVPARREFQSCGGLSENKSFGGNFPRVHEAFTLIRWGLG
jgi:hypothetical protein